MAVKFEIESVFKLTGRGYIVGAKLIEEGNDFWVPEFSKLGGIEITTFLDMPRALDKDGNARLDLFFFQLKDQEDFDKLNQGEIVELFPGDEIKYLSPWMKIDSKGSFEKELVKEISKDHILYGKEVKAIAKREDNDDVIFELENEGMAVVHLTWKGKKESLPNYPRTRIFKHWTELFEKVVVQDNLEYEN